MSNFRKLGKKTWLNIDFIVSMVPTRFRETSPWVTTITMTTGETYTVDETPEEILAMAAGAQPGGTEPPAAR